MLKYAISDALSIISAVSKSRPGIAWEWFQREFQNGNRVLQLELHKIIGVVTRGLNDESRLEELKQFYTRNQHRLGIGKQNTEMAIEIVKRNIALREHKEKVLNWFQERRRQGSARSTVHQDTSIFSDLCNEDFEVEFDLF